MSKPLSETEDKIVKQLKAALQGHRNLATDTFRTIGHLLDNISVPGTQGAASPKSLLVGIALLLRLSNDLRCVGLLASRGYPKQAHTIVASMYDSAHTIAFIGANESLAQEWLEYDDPFRPFRDIHTLMTGAVSKLRLMGLQISVDRAFSEYHALSRLTKANPFLEAASTAENEFSETVSMNAPTAGASTARAAKLALECGVWCVYVGMISLVHEHGATGSFSNLSNELHPIGTRLKELKAGREDQ